MEIFKARIELDIKDEQHLRLNILTGEHVLVSPHRTKRPWQGKVEAEEVAVRPEYDASCYLCPGNTRADGQINPEYDDSFVFTNDYSALRDTTPSNYYNKQELLLAMPVKGICKVISFSPRHDLTLAELKLIDIRKVVDTWCGEFEKLAYIDWIKYIQIFENKGEIMGCSNPHPHGQIWSQSGLPVEVTKEDNRQKEYFQRHGKSLLSAYLSIEVEKKERVVFENGSFVALVPFWAVWPYETLLVSKRHVTNVCDFTSQEKDDLADALKRLTVRYDNLFKTSFPYSAGMHQAPVNSGEQPHWHWHMHFYPPLLRSATVKKFMVGYELLANAQRDITPEFAAEHLRNATGVHYKNCQLV